MTSRREWRGRWVVPLGEEAVVQADWQVDSLSDVVDLVERS
ncbi:hypothetical protein [Streptomyces sp. NPDC094049]